VVAAHEKKSLRFFHGKASQKKISMPQKKISMPQKKNSMPREKGTLGVDYPK